MEAAVVLEIFVKDISHELCEGALLFHLVFESACETLNDGHTLTSDGSSHDTLVSERLDEW